MTKLNVCIIEKQNGLENLMKLGKPGGKQRLRMKSIKTFLILWCLTLVCLGCAASPEPTVTCPPVPAWLTKRIPERNLPNPVTVRAMRDHIQLQEQDIAEANDRFSVIENL